ncbi:MAG: 50S ribosomal protein L11 methyltransferase, partial [Lysobacter sp.]|nr:50S ribosomal protein L11 methyltransferase [Lysobacter sp.]
MYSVGDYGAMADNEIRRVAFHRALASVVEPESVIVELGTGAGLMALFACRLGARRVYAIEPSDAIEVARASAKDNGLADRIVFIQGYSRDVSLPERADILLEDMRGALPWMGRHIPDLVDARRRLLKPGGRIISCRDTAYCAVVEAAERYSKISDPWLRKPESLDLSAGLRFVLNSTYSLRARADQLLTEPRPWAELDYRTIESANARGRIGLQAAREGRGHGLLLWFDGELVPGV